MPTNVYLTSDCFAEVKLEFMLSGPSTDFSGNFHLLEKTVPAKTTSSRKVMSVDRDGWYAGDVVTMGELRISVGGQFVGALQVMLTSLHIPIKNTIWWSARTPGAATTWFTSDHEPHSFAFSSALGSFSFTFQGVGTVGFDDIEVKITAVARTLTALTACGDPVRRLLAGLTVDNQGAATIWTSPMQSPPAWSPVPVPAPVALSARAALSVGYTSDCPPTQALMVTSDQRLAVATAQPSPAVTLLPLGLSGTVLSITASDLQGGPSAWCDVFVVTREGDQPRRLFRRTLTIGRTVSFDGGWDDWGNVASDTVSYAPGRSRYLFTVVDTLVGARRVYYSFASPRSRSWSLWRGMAALPDNALPSNVVGVTWCDNDVPSWVGVVVTAASGALYYDYEDNFQVGRWRKGQVSGVIGPAVSSPLGTHPFVLVRTQPGPALSAARFWVKENDLRYFEPVSDSADAQLFGLAANVDAIDTAYALVQKAGAAVFRTLPA